MNLEKTKAAFITFYSFKGGVGRSMALINTAGILAGRGFHVLVIDLDLEAPGLSYLNPNPPDDSAQQDSLKFDFQPGFVDLLSDAKMRGKDGDLFNLSVEELKRTYTKPYHLPEEIRDFKDGSLQIMPAGKSDAGYAARFNALNLRELYEEGLGEPLIRAFKKKFAEAGVFDYVLVDSRTGFSDEAGICTRDLADHLMILSGLNRQNIAGTCEFLKALRATTKGGETKFDIILSPVPNGEDQLVDDREDRAKLSFAAAWGAPIEIKLQIPYHPQLALTEEPHIFRRRRGYLFEAYRNIETKMLRSIGHDDLSLKTRIDDLLEHGKFLAALNDLRRLIRLDKGTESLLRIVWELVRSERSLKKDKPGSEITREKTTLDRLVDDGDGQRVLEFVIDRILLGNEDSVSDLLLNRLEEKSFDLAGRLYERKINADPSDAELICSYAIFLDQKRDDSVGAEIYFKRAVDVSPTVAEILVHHAVSLDRNGDIPKAEAYFKRALEADPKNSDNLGNYAVFLERRGDLDGAEAYFKRALESDPKNAHRLSDYGQFLTGLNRLTEARETLLSALNNLDRYDQFDSVNVAEACFSLWLVSRMMDQSAKTWEGAFKFAVNRGFERYPWSFDRMLEQAGKSLSPEDLDYAKALASAFLDANKVTDLEKFERWKEIEPVNPFDVVESASP